MTISPWYLRTLAQHLGPVPDQAIEHRSSGHPAVITGAQLSAIAAKPSTATTAQTSNPHSRPGAHRLPAGSFFGGFRTPALGSAARVNDPPASETLHESSPPSPSTAGDLAAPPTGCGSVHIAITGRGAGGSGAGAERLRSGAARPVRPSNVVWAGEGEGDQCCRFWLFSCPGGRADFVDLRRSVR